MTHDELVDLTERLRNLGAEEFTLEGYLRVKFRDSVVTPREVTPRERGESAPEGRDLRSVAEKQGIGPPKFPGSGAP